MANLDKLIEFIVAIFGSNYVEIFATILGLINVALIIRRSIWNYPFGIAMVILYFWIFFEYRLYAESALQIYFLVIQIIGWFWWLKGRGLDGKIIVLRLTSEEALTCLGAGLTLAIGLGWFMKTYTNASLPFLDSTVASLSVVAQFLLARQRLENWIVWIVTDVLSIGIYIYKSLYPTAVLYTVFLAMAIGGLATWVGHIQDQKAST